MFRKLNEDERDEFIQWARDNWSKEQLEPNPLWHPVVRHEWHRITLDYLEDEAIYNDIMDTLE